MAAATAEASALHASFKVPMAEEWTVLEHLPVFGHGRPQGVGGMLCLSCGAAALAKRHCGQCVVVPEFTVPHATRDLLSRRWRVHPVKATASLMRLPGTQAELSDDDERRHHVDGERSLLAKLQIVARNATAETNFFVCDRSNILLSLLS